jgi:hypothetical protein
MNPCHDEEKNREDPGEQVQQNCHGERDLIASELGILQEDATST